jgi:hypothetical protein
MHEVSVLMHMYPVAPQYVDTKNKITNVFDTKNMNAFDTKKITRIINMFDTKSIKVSAVLPADQAVGAVARGA